MKTLLDGGVDYVHNPPIDWEILLKCTINLVLTMVQLGILHQIVSAVPAVAGLKLSANV